MRITAVEEYGLRCLIALARRGEEANLTIPEIAQLEGLSVPYASKLLAILRKAGFVSAVRGRTGGFSISRSAREINLYDVVTALGGPLIDSDHCSRFAGTKDQCVHKGNCTVHDMLDGLAGYMEAILRTMSLHDMITKENVIHASIRPIPSTTTMAATKSSGNGASDTDDTMQ